MTHIPDDAARHPVRSFAPAGEHWKSLEALDALESKRGYPTHTACSNNMRSCCVSYASIIDITRRMAVCWDSPPSVTANLKFQTQRRSQATLLQGEVLLQRLLGKPPLVQFFCHLFAPAPGSCKRL